MLITVLHFCYFLHFPRNSHLGNIMIIYLPPVLDRASVLRSSAHTESAQVSLSLSTSDELRARSR